MWFFFNIYKVGIIIPLFALPAIRNVNHKLHLPIPEQGWPNPAIWSTSCFVDLAMISKDNFSSQQETTVMATTTSYFLHLRKFLPEDKPFQFVLLLNLWILRRPSSEPKDLVLFLDFSKIWPQYWPRIIKMTKQVQEPRSRLLVQNQRRGIPLFRRKLAFFKKGYF